MTTYSDAYREALASVPNDNPKVNTISIEHPDMPTIYIVEGFVDFPATLEDLVTNVIFKAGHFDLSLPKKNATGVPMLNFVVGNSDGVAGAYLEAVKHSEKKVEIVNRVYLSNDPSQPALNPPLRLQLKDARVDRFQVTASAVFAKDMKNTLVPKERYTRTRFPGLGG